MWFKDWLVNYPSELFIELFAGLCKLALLGAVFFLNLLQLALQLPLHTNTSKYKRKFVELGLQTGERR